MRILDVISKISLTAHFGSHYSHAFLNPMKARNQVHSSFQKWHRATMWKNGRERTVMNTSAEDSNDEKNKEISSSPWKSYNPDALTPGARYSLCISAVVPRPVGVLTSISPDTSVVNCAPFSYTSLSSHDPPILTHGICLSKGKKKDSLRNIEATGEWVCNVLEVGYLEKANDTSSPMPSDLSEVEEVNLDTTPCEVVKAPRLIDARVSMECKLVHKYEVKNDAGDHTTTIVMGRVVRFHIHKDVLEKGREEDQPLVDLCQLQPVGRAGGVTYWPVGVQSTTSDSKNREEWTDRVALKRPGYPIPPKE